MIAGLTSAAVRLPHWPPEGALIVVGHEICVQPLEVGVIFEFFAPWVRVFVARVDVFVRQLELESALGVEEEHSFDLAGCVEPDLQPVTRHEQEQPHRVPGLPVDFLASRQKGQALSAFELSSMEKLHIQRVLNHTHGNKMAAARLLNIGLTTLYRKIEEYKLV